jgi:hypothetical protein
LIEDDPTSRSRQHVLKEDLAKANADQDTEVVEAAKLLLDTLHDRASGTAIAIRVNLKDIKAASLRLSDIIATGTGVNVHGAEFTGDIEIEKVRAGSGASPNNNFMAAEQSSSAVSLNDVNARCVCSSFTVHPQPNFA